MRRFFAMLAERGGGCAAGRRTADDTVLIVYTSGTTGFPKGAMHSQRSFVTGGEAFVQRVYLQDDDRVMIVLPLFHINALFYSVAGTLAAGCSMVDRAALLGIDVLADRGRLRARPKSTSSKRSARYSTNRPRSEFRPEHKLRAVYGVRHSMEDDVPRRVQHPASASAATA